MNKRTTGTIFEEKAEELVLKEGYEILEKNYRGVAGEIDFICAKDKETVFVEVKYRKTDEFGEGFEAVDTRKMKRIYKTAEEYLSREGILDGTFRFDCISFLNNNVKWMKNVIWGDEFGF